MGIQFIFAAMKEDIQAPEVKDIGLAVVQEENMEGDGMVWNCYLLNMKRVVIEGVLVSSKGYGKVTGEEKETSMLRHFLDEVPPRCAKRIEPIMENLFGLNNEYWVSFFEDGKMYDKKFVLLPETISEENFTEVPLMGMRGVLLVSS